MATIGGVRCRCQFVNMEGSLNLSRAVRSIHLATAFVSSFLFLPPLLTIQDTPF
jgi:hypothetical protein